MRARRTDANHGAIIAALRRFGATVVDTSRMGQGFPDILIGFRNKTWMAEIKDGDKPPSRRKLKSNQKDFHDEWRGSPIVILESIDDVINLIASAET